jgi:hypothetical protein
MATQDKVDLGTPGQILGIGIGASTVEVRLMAGREALAARIAQMFGSKVSITVGLNSYCGGLARSPLCTSMPLGDPLPSGLTLKLVLNHGTIRTGDFGDATLTAHEDGPGSFQMDTGQPLVAQVVSPGTQKVVGTFDGGIAGTGYAPKIGPGQDETVPVIFGTTRCDGGLGSAMPPGHYDVVVYMHPEGRGRGPVYYAPPVPVVVAR